MPYALDLVRLAVSAVLADETQSVGGRHLRQRFSTATGDGLEKPERDRARSRSRLAARDRRGERRGARGVLENDLEAARKPAEGAATAALPSQALRCGVARTGRRCATSSRARRAPAASAARAGSAITRWRGAPVVREAKVLVPSAWNLVQGRGGFSIRWNEIATGCHRAPDPWFRLTDNIVVRRLSPNNRKIEAEGRRTTAKFILGERMLKAMGRELAAIHLGSVDRSAEIARDLKRRKNTWLRAAAQAAQRKVESDFSEWAAAHPRAGEKSQEGQEQEDEVVAPMTRGDPTDQQNALLRQPDASIPGRRYVWSHFLRKAGVQPRSRPAGNFRDAHAPSVRCRQAPHLPQAARIRLLGDSQSVGRRLGALPAGARLQGAGLDLVRLRVVGGACRQRGRRRHGARASRRDRRRDRRAGERGLRGRLRGRPGRRRQERHALLRDRRRRPVDRGFDRQQGEAALRHAVRGRAHEGGARRDRQRGRRGDAHRPRRRLHLGRARSRRR